MSNLKTESYLKLIFIVSLISIISAYFIEYVLGYQPCNLCLIERIPYMLSIALITINYFLKKNNQFITILLMLIFIFSFLISVYHFGIEQDIFEESAVCGLKQSHEIITKEEVLKQLQQKTISCKDVTFRIFGLSLTAVNMVISFIIIVLLAKILIKYAKIKK